MAHPDAGVQARPESSGVSHAASLPGQGQGQAKGKGTHRIQASGKERPKVSLPEGPGSYL